MRKSPWLWFAFAACLLLAACAPGPNSSASHPPDSAGFWLGLWHGIIAPITFIIGRFTASVGMYEVHNNGGWYDFGYLIGLGTLHGGGAAGRHARRRNRRRTDD